MKNIFEGLGSGYESADGHICMMRCFECGKENYGPVVNSGYCAHCEFTPNKNPEGISSGVSKIQSKQDSSD